VRLEPSGLVTLFDKQVGLDWFQETVLILPFVSDDDDPLPLKSDDAKVR
jgi:hypothetical protein